MDREGLIVALRTEGSRLAAVGPDELDRTVPTCPGWTVADLVTHVGRVQRWALGALDTPPETDPPRFGARPDPDEDLPAWFRRGLEDLAGRLAEADPDARCWTFTGPGTRRFWLRRQPIEAAIHRLDLDAALGRPAAGIDPDLAAVGIEEWLELESARWYSPEPDLVGSVHLHATDDEGEWFVEVDGSGLAWRTGHLKGDVAVRGDRAALLGLLWRRRSTSGVEVFGDTALLDRFLDAAAV